MNLSGAARIQKQVTFGVAVIVGTQENARNAGARIKQTDNHHTDNTRIVMKAPMARMVGLMD